MEKEKQVRECGGGRKEAHGPGYSGQTRNIMKSLISNNRFLIQLFDEFRRFVSVHIIGC